MLGKPEQEAHDNEPRAYRVLRGAAVSDCGADSSEADHTFGWTPSARPSLAISSPRYIFQAP